MTPRRWLPLAALTLAACGDPLPPAAFTADGPALRPDVFFEGRTRSFGVMEDRAGRPTDRFAVDGEGRREADGSLTLRQTVRPAEGEGFQRLWHMRDAGDGRYTATGPAIQGTATGEARGRVFRLSYTETLPPGGWLRTVRFDHWMYLAEDGDTLINRFTVRKLGVVVARATEVFARVP